jgi:hypothetical protein
MSTNDKPLALRLADVERELEAQRLYARALCKAVDAATDFAGTVAGGSSWWDEVWAEHASALDRARDRISLAQQGGAQPAAARVPLTDEQISSMRQAGYLDADDYPEAWSYERGFRDAERAHGIGHEGGAA